MVRREELSTRQPLAPYPAIRVPFKNRVREPARLIVNSHRSEHSVWNGRIVSLGFRRSRRQPAMQGRRSQKLKMLRACVEKWAGDRTVVTIALDAKA